MSKKTYQLIIFPSIEGGYCAAFALPLDNCIILGQGDTKEFAIKDFISAAKYHFAMFPDSRIGLFEKRLRAELVDVDIDFSAV